MKETFIGFSGLIIQVVVGLSPLWFFNWALKANSALRGISGRVTSRTQGLTNKARERAQESVRQRLGVQSTARLRAALDTALDALDNLDQN